MGSDKNCATAWLGSSRSKVTIPKPIGALNAPLRAAELEAMRPGREIAPDDQSNPEPEDCLTTLALRAPLLCSMFRAHPGRRNLSMNRSPIPPLSEISAVHVDSAKSVNQGPKAPVAQTGRRLKISAGLNFAAALRALCPTELETMDRASCELSVSASGGLPPDRHYQTLASKAPDALLRAGRKRLAGSWRR